MSKYKTPEEIEDIYKNIDGVIDQNIRGLSDVMNALPGILISGSCGGHEDHQTPGRAAEGCFYMAFAAEPEDPDQNDWRPTVEAWTTIGIIEAAVNLTNVYMEDLAGEMDGETYCELIVCNTCDSSPETISELSFEVTGRHGCNPDLLAAFITAVRENTPAVPQGGPNR